MYFFGSVYTLMLIFFPDRSLRSCRSEKFLSSSVLFSVVFVLSAVLVLVCVSSSESHSCGVASGGSGRWFLEYRYCPIFFSISESKSAGSSVMNSSSCIFRKFMKWAEEISPVFTSFRHAPCGYNSMILSGPT